MLYTQFSKAVLSLVLLVGVNLLILRSLYCFLCFLNLLLQWWQFNKLPDVSFFATCFTLSYLDHFSTKKFEELDGIVSP